MYIDCHVIIFKQFRFIFDAWMVGESPDLLSLSSLVFKDEDKL